MLHALRLAPRAPAAAASSAQPCASARGRAARPTAAEQALGAPVRLAHTAHHTAHARDLVRKRDYNAYLTHFAYPHPLQAHFFALRAFHVELASIKDDVSSELLGRVRMGWWRDAVRGIYANRPPAHPVALALRDAVQDPQVLRTGGLVEDHFQRIIDAREADLADPLAPPTLADLEQYAEATSSRMLYLQLNLLGLSERALDELFSHVGKAIGLSILVGALPFHTHPPPRARASGGPGGTAMPSASRYAPQGGAVPRTPTLPLPLEYLVEANVRQEDVFRNGINARGLRDAVFLTATRANDYLITARTHIRDAYGGRIYPRALGPLLLGVGTQQFLHRLEKADFNQYDARLQHRAWTLPWHLWRASRRGNL